MARSGSPSCISSAFESLYFTILLPAGALDFHLGGRFLKFVSVRFCSFCNSSIFCWSCHSFKSFALLDSPTVSALETSLDKEGSKSATENGWFA